MFTIVCLSGTADPGWTASPSASSSGMSTQAISAGMFERTIVQYLHTQIASRHIDLKIRLVSPLDAVLVRQGKSDLQVLPGPFVAQTGRRVFRVGIHVDGHLERTVNAIADVQAEGPVVVPVRWIKVHDVLEPDDVVTMTRPLTSLQQDIIVDETSAIGKKAVRPLSPHQPIKQSYLAVPPVVHSGDRVVIEARRGGLLVQTVGIAKGAGEIGKTIQVENQTSGRLILARVAGAGLVEVEF